MEYTREMEELRVKVWYILVDEMHKPKKDLVYYNFQPMTRKEMTDYFKKAYFYGIYFDNSVEYWEDLYDDIKAHTTE